MPKIKFKFDLTVLTKKSSLMALINELDQLDLAYIIEREELYFFVNIALEGQPEKLITSMPGMAFDEAIQEIFYSAYKTATWYSYYNQLAELKDSLPESVTIEVEAPEAETSAELTDDLYRHKLIWPAREVETTRKVEQILTSNFIRSL